MRIRDLFVTTFSALLCTPLVLLGVGIASGQVMQSTSYRIQSDSVNFGGGLSTSTSYNLESSAGEVATSDATSNTYNLRAGYQQMVTSFISISAIAPVSMTPTIVGITGGVADGSTTVTVTTDSPAGYDLSIEASQNPAMQKGADSIANYVPAGNPDFTFTTNTYDSHFGYSPSGSNVISRFKDDGASCNTGSLETALACWDGLSTTPESIARSTTANTPNGATTTVYFRVGIGSSVVQPAGTYTATTTLTALPL